MSTEMFWAKDADPSRLEGRQVAVIGYGSQGRAHALNLRDSGVAVRVGVRPGGQSWEQAIGDAFLPVEVSKAVVDADLIAILVPDMTQQALFEREIAPFMSDEATILFAHGFNVRYQMISAAASHDVVLVAPKGPGTLVRRQYAEGRGVPCLAAVHQDASGEAWEQALSYAHHIGGTRAGVFRTTFAEETETDLFGEQAVLCGGMTELVTAGFEVLTEAGYSPEVAYFECLHELKLIVDLIYEGGLAKMHQFVSDTAKFGDLTRGPRVVDAAVKATMRRILEEIRDGRFAKEWSDENQEGGDRYRSLLAEDLNHPVESVGRRLRSQMSWIESSAS